MNFRISKRVLRIIIAALLVATAALARAQIIGASNRIISLFPIMGWVESGFEIIVMIGCAGELGLLFKKEPEHDDIEGHKIRRMWEKVWMFMVVLGVAGSVPCLMISSKESDEAKTFAAAVGTTNAWLVASNIVSESNNLILRSNVVRLEKNARPREWRLMEQSVSWKNFKERFLSDSKIKVDILYPADDPEAFGLAKFIRDALQEDGWEIPEFRPAIESDAPPFESGLPYPKYPTNAPLLTRMGVGGAGSGASMGVVALICGSTTFTNNFVSSPAHPNISPSGPVAALRNGLQVSGFGCEAMRDSRLPNDLVKIVMGQK